MKNILKMRYKNRLPGLLITFEGVEGSGKSTQFNRLANRLESKGLPLLIAREPGGTTIGESIRGVLLDPQNSEMCSDTEFLLYMAARMQIMMQKGIPHLEKGGILLLDRFGDSSNAYQGGGRKISVEFILAQQMNFLIKPVSGKMLPIIPHKTIIVDVPVSVGRARKQAQQSLDRLEQERIEFHETVRATYKAMANGDYDHLPYMDHRRFQVLDGTIPADTLETLTYDAVKPLLIAKGYISE